MEEEQKYRNGEVLCRLLWEIMTSQTKKHDALVSGKIARTYSVNKNSTVLGR